MNPRVPVLLPHWAAVTIAPLLQPLFTGSFTCHIHQGAIGSVEYTTTPCTCCGERKRVRVANQPQT